MEDDEYGHVSREKLKLKSDSGVTKKKKKKKDKDREREREATEKVVKAAAEAEAKQAECKRTPAEIAFKKMREKTQKERISQKASMTHKQRVEKFNQHLDSLTEHFDIPKVSWTK